jgi:protein-tyrosine phosphatase
MNVLMVCLGNICRSPIAQGILEKKVQALGLDWNIDSAGTSGWHDGERPDARAISASALKGVDISGQVSRKITLSDLDAFDLILVMDASNYQDVIRLCTREEQKKKVHLLLQFRYPGMNRAVPDPYYDGRFNEVFDLLDESMEDVIKAFV